MKPRATASTYNLAIGPAWRWALILTLLGGLYFLKAYLSVIALALLLAYLFYPLMQGIQKRFKRQGLAIALTTIISLLVVAIPLVVIMVIAVSQAVSLAESLKVNGLMFGNGTLQDKVLAVSHSANGAIEGVAGIKDAISDGTVVKFLHTTLPSVLKGVIKAAVGLVSGIPSFFTMLIIYLFVFTGLLAGGTRLVALAKDLSPFDDQVNELYMTRIGAMAKAMVKGQMIIAVAQGVVSAAVLALVGFSQYFWLMALVFTFLSFIPLGAGIVTIPLGILLMAFGNFGAGVLVLLNHFVVVTNIDNYIRPKVVPKDARLPAALTILGAFAGVGYFGFLGVVYGPIIMILFVTTIETYVRQKKSLAKTVAKPQKGHA